MDSNAPRHFTLKESIVAVRGLLPEIDTEATEDEVCSEIQSVITNSGEDTSTYTLYGFEFTEATGKYLYVPAKLKGFQWSGRALKNLAGSGQVYVRLLYNPDSSSSDSDFPAFSEDESGSNVNDFS